MPARSSNLLLMNDLRALLAGRCQNSANLRQVADGVNGPFLVALDEVSVPHRHRDLRVAQKLLDRNNVDARHHQVAREGVAERVDVHVLQSELPGQAFEVEPEASILGLIFRFFNSVSPLGFQLIPTC